MAKQSTVSSEREPRQAPARGTSAGRSRSSEARGTESASGNRAPERGPQSSEWLSRIEQDAHELLGAIEALSADVSLSLRDRVDRRPLTALGAGFAAGYVLGGGLTLRLLSMLLATTGRTALANVIAGAAREQRSARRGDR